MSDARPPPGLRLCAVDELPDPGARGFRFGPEDGGGSVGEDARVFQGLVVRRGAEVAGFVDSCPHVGAPLSDDPDRYLTRRGDFLVCFNHGALFRPHDGMCVVGPCVGRALRPWPVAVEDGAVVTG